MEFYEAIQKRKTVRAFLNKPVDFDKIKRILEAGNLAPTWNHNRNWSYIVLQTAEEKAYAFDYAKRIAEQFDAERYLNMPRPYPVTLGQKMYGYPMPRQFSMLQEAPYVIIPVFKCKELNGEYVSKLNPFATIWCVIENIFLAATAERLACSMRIPLNEEHDLVKAKLKVPKTYMIPVFIGIGYTALKTADRALMASVLLGTVTDDTQLDEFADQEMSADLCEQCAEAGYQLLQKKYNDADCDSDLLERRMLKELELLFMKNVEADI